jgi:ATP-dependent helicase/nuclease subunit B
VSGLRIVFGERLDGGAWPLVPDGAALGTAVVGPLGLLSLVETSAGLGGPSIPAARRIAVMRHRLARLAERPCFWNDSFVVDPWAVARELLAWRDELVEAGWTAHAIVDPPPRLADLAALEACDGPALPSGLADRLVAAAQVFGADLEHPISEVFVIDDKATLAAGIARLLDRMAAHGVAVSYLAASTGACASSASDLARVQSWLSAGKMKPLTGDGTFVLLRGMSEGMEAEAVADWLQSGTNDAATVVVLGQPSGMLDGAMRRRGLPQFGHLDASPLRGAIQVLSLAFAVRWRPFDPSPLLDLLTLPQSPVPASVGAILARMLNEAPGRDGPLWTAAIERSREVRRKRFAQGGLTGTDLERRVERDLRRWLPWLAGDLFDEAPGMPAEAAHEICARVAAWSARMAPVARGPVAAVGGFAVTLSQVVREAGLDPLPRVQLERMIDAVVADGVDAEHIGAEASAWSHVSHPAQVWDAADSVVWWGFGSQGASRLPGRWTLEETDALRAVGCPAADPAVALIREAAGWRRALLNVRERALLVVPPGTEEGEQSHPLLHELQPLLAGVPRGMTFQSEALLASESIALSGRSITRKPVLGRALPQPRREWTISPGTINPRPVESASSIALLLGCPFAWSLQYPARLKPSRRSEVPKGDRLLGLLAHALAEEIFQPGNPPTPALARQLAEQRLPALIDERATPLRSPGAASDHARALARLPAAMEILASHLTKLGATVVGTEVKREAVDVLAPAIVLDSRMDMLIEVGGAPAVIDMKWSRTDRYRRDEIVKGQAVQLAVYGRVAGTDVSPAQGAYFMLSQARLLPAGDNLFGTAPSAPPLADVWQATRESWRTRLARLGQGRVAALAKELPPGPDGDSNAVVPLPLEAPCRFCDKSKLCGLERVL